MPTASLSPGQEGWVQACCADGLHALYLLVPTEKMAIRVAKKAMRHAFKQQDIDLFECALQILEDTSLNLWNAPTRRFFAGVMTLSVVGPESRALIDMVQRLLRLILAHPHRQYAALLLQRRFYGVTALMQRSGQGHIECVQLLLAAGMPVDIRASYAKRRRTALHYAAAAGHSEVINALLAAGAQSGTKSLTESTPVHEATVHNRRDALAAFVDAGVDVDALFADNAYLKERAAKLL